MAINYKYILLCILLYRWVETVKTALINCGRTEYTEDEFNRFFRRVYQHYGSLEGYEKLPDAVSYLFMYIQRYLCMHVDVLKSAFKVYVTMPIYAYMLALYIVIYIYKGIW